MSPSLVRITHTSYIVIVAFSTLSQRTTFHFRVKPDGAGSQRSDPKAGDPADFPTGHRPQGDAIRIYNFVRLVRDAE